MSGAILPIVALGFIKSLVDYIRPEEPKKAAQPVEDLGFLGEPAKKEVKPVSDEDQFGAQNINNI